MLKNSANPQPPLWQLFAAQLGLVKQLEQQTAKLYLKFEKAAHTSELVKCLSPLSTDSEQHLNRLKLLSKATGIMPSKDHQLTTQTPFSLKKPSIIQDLQLIAQAMHLQQQRLAYYNLLQALATTLDHEIALQLISQTLTDHQQTSTWLRQILLNVVAPQIKQMKEI